MKKLLLCAAALSLMAISAPGYAQSSSSAAAGAASADISPVMAICKDVIEREYKGDESRRNECVNGVAAFLKALEAPSASVDPTISDLVVALTELYEEDTDCKIADTELPQAIRTAAALMLEDTLRADLIAIGDQVAGCTFQATAAINDTSSSEEDGGTGGGPVRTPASP